jgi:hypothetical protein
MTYIKTIFPNIITIQNLQGKLFTVMEDNFTSYLTSIKLLIVLPFDNQTYAAPNKHGHWVDLDTRSYVFSFANDTRTVFFLIFIKEIELIISFLEVPWCPRSVLLDRDEAS